MYRRQCGLFASELFVEIARISSAVLNEQSAHAYVNGIVSTYNRGEVGRGYAFVHNIVKADVLEERMSLDLLGIRLARPESSSGVTGQQLEPR